MLSGAPLGIDTRHTGKSLRKMRNRGLLGMNEMSALPETLIPLWEDGLWDELIPACRNIKSWPKDADSSRGADWLPEISPEALLYGAALFEQGKHEKAMEYINSYSSFERFWALDFYAIQRYYVARSYELRGELQEALDWYMDAWSRWSYDCINDAIQRLADQRMPGNQWIGETFPVDYELKTFKSAPGRTLRLSDTLNAMEPGQLFFIVTMRDLPCILAHSLQGCM
jgi:tetratricopeptide (TPR) repeat protein